MKRIYIITAVAVVVLASVSVYVARQEYRKPTLEVYFFYLNRGRSIFFRTPHNKTALIDGGQNSEVIRELSGVLPFYKRRIDTVILTSSAPKNIGGLTEVLERYEVERVFQPEIMGTSTALTSLQKVLRKKKLFPELLTKGDTFDIDGVHFITLFPDPLFKFNKTSLPELVLKVGYASTTILLLGDVSKTIQKTVMKDVEQAEIVEFAHGGTKSRVSAELLQKVNPSKIISTKRGETLRFEF